MAANIRRSNGHRRTQLRRRVLAEEDTCHLCGASVDTSLPPGQPASPEVDELVPVSLGGDPLDRSNVRLAHRLCNQRRSNMPVNAGAVRALGRIRTSRDW